MKKNREKVDYEALGSPFMRIPKMRVEGARALMDLGIREVYELRGRDPQSLMADFSKLKKKEVPPQILNYFTIAVDFAESNP